MPHALLSSRRALRLTGAAALMFALPALAFAQPNMAGAPTATRPITQPNLSAPTVDARARLLPSGPYRLSIDLPANGRAAALSTTEAGTLTHTGSTVSFTVTGAPGGSFSGTIDGSGALALSLAQGGAALHLNGAATGGGASGDAFVTGPGAPESPHGTFEFSSPSLPQAREHAGGLWSLFKHTIGCWFLGGAGC